MMAMHSMDADTYWREMNEAQLLEDPCDLHGAPVFTPPPVRDCVQQLQPGESQFVWVVCSVPEANMQPDSTVEWNCLPLNIAMVLEREVAKYTRQKSRAQKALAEATQQVENGMIPVPKPALTKQSTAAKNLERLQAAHLRSFLFNKAHGVEMSQTWIARHTMQKGDGTRAFKEGFNTKICAVFTLDCEKIWLALLGDRFRQVVPNRWL